ncbi:hypothetical protein HPP92_018827 [Vanilla planifolia]|uniref:Rhodanese domain-containing protein n=1 Tax=Vanilla planifolia TaxID=51239 RepID=A0A835UKD9_VANPL|nr:hypothetical protein HPP92_019401 [Vanilla planifolia]KAG0464663.1 hypothetical protein HPP92_018827 [Vanilla planifolia]
MALAVRAAWASGFPHQSTLKHQRRPSPLLLTPSPDVLDFLTVIYQPHISSFEAKAFTFPKEEIVTSLTKVEETIDLVEDAGLKALDFSQYVIKVVIDALKPPLEAGLPVLQTVGDEVVKIAVPVVSDASNRAKEALEGIGIDTGLVISAAKMVAEAGQQVMKVIDVAKPVASSTLETISSADASSVVASGGGLLLAYLLLPPLWSIVSYNFRGYKGNLSPAQTLDLLTSQNYFLIDIRSVKEKTNAGVPRLPSSAKSKIISIPVEELPSKLKELVRNARTAEAEIVALKISFLKRISKGSKIVIMDSYCDTARLVAKALTGLGFKSCWVMSGGFSGGKGWLQSRLGSDSYNVSIAEVLSPSRTIPAAAYRLGITSTTSPKLLPGKTDN